MKNNTVKRFIGFDRLDVERFLSYLKDMASQGYIFKGYSMFRMKFEVSDPLALDFSCGYTGDNDNEKLDKLTMKSGWVYICTREKIHYYKRDAIDQTNDLYQAGMSFDNIKKITKITMISQPLLLCFSILVLSSIVVMNDPSLTFRYLSGMNVSRVALFIFYVYFMYNAADSLLCIIKMNSRHKKGLVLTNRKAYKGKLIINRIVKTVIFTFAILFLTLSLFTFRTSQRNRSSIQSEHDDLGVVSLEDFSRVGYVADPSKFEIRALDFHNFVQRNRSIFVPNQIELHQQVKYPSEKWSDNSGMYTPSMQSIMYWCLTENIAGNLAQDLAKETQDGPFALVDHQNFDDLWVHIDVISVDIIARVDQSIYVINYNGEEPYEKILKALINNK